MSKRTLLTMQVFDASRVAKLQGDVIELGVAAGSTTFPLARLMAEQCPEKVLYACDTFEGLPYTESAALKKGSINWGNRFISQYEIAQQTNICMVKGMCESTLPERLENHKFCFAWLDMDLENSTRFAFKFLEDRIVIGGVVGFHDYKFHLCPGIEKVVAEIDRTKWKQLVHESTCIYFERIR